MCTVNQDGEHHENSKIMRIIKKYGMNQIELKQAFAGDIVSIGGFHESTVGNVINELGKNHVIKSIPIDPPMLSLTLTVNDSPIKGTDGDKLTISQIRERVIRESEDDVSLQVQSDKGKSEFVTLHGRGDLHLGILIEKMRREGFELAVTAPQVIMKEDPENPGTMLEPYEEVVIDTNLEHVASIIDKLNDRKGVLLDIEE